MSHNEYGKKFLNGLHNYRVDTGLTAFAIRAFLQSLDCPRALTVLLLYESGEHEQLTKLEFDPLWYDSLQRIRDAYAATKLLSKFKGLTPGFDTKQVAIKKFEEFELLCKQTNSRFRRLHSDPLYKGSLVWLHHAVVRKIASVLGDFDPEEFVSGADWGPGASTLIKRRDASSAIKFQCETGITRDLHSLFPTDLLKVCYPWWGQHLESAGFPSYQVGNKVITVAKDASTDRVIAVEPGINLWFQLALGNMIKRRLLGVGIDLADQGRNQNLARIGSITGELGTLDLSSASDSISEAIVRELIPPRWYSVMDSCRSHHGLLDGRIVKWEKFSSMGNGFTFPLQSLIFYAIAFCCVEYEPARTGGVKTISVYGDDIIIPVSCVELFSECLAFYGFRINVKKSHFASPFRESCGGHYYSGFDVKPIYLKDRLSSLQAVFRLANAVRRYASRTMNFMACDARFRYVFERLVTSVPRALRLRIPETLGDGGFISNFDEASPSRLRHQIEGFGVYQLVERRKTYSEERLGYLLTELWRLSKRATSEAGGVGPPSVLKAIRSLTERDTEGEGRNSVPTSRSALLVVKSAVAQWSDLGPWN